MEVKQFILKMSSCKRFVLPSKFEIQIYVKTYLKMASKYEKESKAIERVNIGMR